MRVGGDLQLRRGVGLVGLDRPAESRGRPHRSMLGAGAPHGERADGLPGQLPVRVEPGVEVRHGAPSALERHLRPERPVHEGPEEVHADAGRRHRRIVELGAHRRQRERLDVAAELRVVAPPGAIGGTFVDARAGVFEGEQVLQQVGRVTHGARPYVGRPLGDPSARSRPDRHAVPVPSPS